MPTEALKQSLAEQMFGFVPLLQQLYDPKTKRPRVARWKPRFHHPSYTLAFLYKTPLPGNRWQGDRAILDLATGLGDGLLNEMTKDDVLDNGDDKPDGTPSTEEWPLYYLARTAEVLGADLNASSRARWTRFAEGYARLMLPRPFFFTSPNHEAWRCAAIARAAESFGKREWIAQALFMVRAQGDYQTPEGFWEEGRHHSVSSSYNRTMIDPLFLLWKQTGDQMLGVMVRRLAEFMTVWTLPDSGTCGCLDGRLSYTPKLGALGLCFLPRGRRMIELAQATSRRLKMHDPQGPYYSMSYWNAFIQIANACDTYRCLEEGPVEPLPVETDGFRTEVHSGTFDAAIHRRGPWCGVVSGIVSDISVGAATPFRLSRESRLDLWHEKAGLVIGGGNGPAGSEIPHALVHVVPKWTDASCEFGRVEGNLKKRQALYYPRAAKAGTAPGEVSVRLTYAHARVRILARFEEDHAARVIFQAECSDLRKLYLQLPIVAYHDAQVLVDGRALVFEEGGATQTVAVNEAVEVRESCYEARKIIRPPQGVKAMLRFPLQPLRAYGPLDPDERYKSSFELGLLSVEIPEPPAHSEWTFSIQV